MADLRRSSLARLRTSQTRLRRVIRCRSPSCRSAEIRALLRRPLARAILGAGGSTGPAHMSLG
jgi:hypothetical protein